MNAKWYDDPSTVHAVAAWAVENGEILTLNDLLYYFEKPWKYDELHEAAEVG